MKILIADDDLSTIQMLTGILTKKGFEVIATHNGSETFEVIKSKDIPDIFIIDWIMPDISGIQICRVLRTLNPKPYIIMLTSKSEVRDIIKALDNGADDFISKPFDINELNARLRVGLRYRSMQKELLEQSKIAQQANQTKTEFLSTVTHEIRNPLNGILGVLTQVMDGPLDSNQFELCQVIQSTAKSLNLILNDILDLSKIEAQRMEIEHIPFDLIRVLKECTLLMSSLIKDKEVELHLSLNQQREKWLLGDPYRIRQIVVNLISNAIKFTEKGTITVELDIEDQVNSSQIKIWIRDTGIGIPDDKLAKLFNRYQQGEASIARRFGGTGLGLSICKDLIQLMQGQIGVDSVVDQGSNFWIQLQLEHTVNPVSVSQEWVKHFPGHKILLIEDNPLNLKIALRLLENMDLIVHTATNYDQALNLLREQTFDLILLDLHLPDADGFTCAHAFRRRDFGIQNPDTPIIALSASNRSEEIAHCLEAGMNDFIAKPIEKEQLILILNEYLLPDKIA